MAISRGEIHFVELGPTKGKEIDVKRRPVVVLSINDINTKPLVVTVIPGGTRATEKRLFRHEVKVEPSVENGLSQPTIFQCIQIKALDHSRFDRPRVGTIAADDLQRLEQTVKLCLGLP
jgi:mRNA interferase MazF